MPIQIYTMKSIQRHHTSTSPPNDSANQLDTLKPMSCLVLKGSSIGHNYTAVSLQYIGHNYTAVSLQYYWP